MADARLKRAGVSGFNKPKRTPSHPKKSHVVVAKVGSEVKTIRFGQQGVSGSPKKSGESASYAARRKSFKARHAKNISKAKCLLHIGQTRLSGNLTKVGDNEGYFGYRLVR